MNCPKCGVDWSDVAVVRNAKRRRPRHRRARAVNGCAMDADDRLHELKERGK